MSDLEAQQSCPSSSSVMIDRPTSTAAVRGMFDSIAPTYDLLNSVLSLGLHSLWERRVEGLLELPASSESICLDMCSGTGALVPRLAKRFKRVVAADISTQMLAYGQKRHAGVENCTWVEADAQALPFEDCSFDAATVSYGIRNLPDPQRGLSELHRVCRGGAELVVLEFGQPSNTLWKFIFSLYGRYVIPFIGALISGSRAPYEYLPKTASIFPCGEAFEGLLRDAGWHPVNTISLCGGVAFLYKARKGGIGPRVGEVEI